MPDIGTGLSIGSSLLGGMMEGDAASEAAGVQAGIAQGQTAESRRQFDAMRALLQPYVGAGTSALGQQMALLGLGGIPREQQSYADLRARFLPQFTSTTPGAPGVAAPVNPFAAGPQSDQWAGLTSPYGPAATQPSQTIDEQGLEAAIQQQMAQQGATGDPRAMQAAAVSQFEQSPYFQAITKQAENAILQSGSATGGLRGGNIQGALAGTRPILLQNLIDKQLANLSGIASQGANAAAGVGQAGMTAGQQINTSQGQLGAAQAGGILGQAGALTGAIGNIGGVLASRFPAGGVAAQPGGFNPDYSLGGGGGGGGFRLGASSGGFRNP